MTNPQITNTLWLTIKNWWKIRKLRKAAQHVQQDFETIPKYWQKYYCAKCGKEQPCAEHPVYGGSTPYTIPSDWNQEINQVEITCNPKTTTREE